MAGRHRRSSRRRSSVARLGAPGGLAAAAVTATSLSTALMTGTTTAAAPSVDLVALITPANSTAQIFAGTTYYGTNYEDEYGAQQVVPFFLGPQGIADAVGQNSNERNVILASGWGAGQTGTALGQLSEDELDSIDLVILDNNSNRAGGGFWTTYAVFAPLLGTSAEPTPSNLDVPILDVAYEYNINSNAPTDPTNVFSLGNSLAAYAYGYGGEQTAVIPPAALAEIEEAKTNPDVNRHHYVVRADGTVDVYDSTGNITYVTYESENLPLTRPLRLIPGGDILADALDPTLTELVNAGYQDGQPIPTDPRVPRPMTPFSSINNLDGVPGSVQEGLEDGVETAQDDLASPGNFVTKPLGEVGKLPVLGSLVSLPTTNLGTTRLANNSPNKFSPGSNSNAATSSSGSSGTSGSANPVQKFSDRINEAVNRVTGGLQNDKNDAQSNPSED